MSADDKESLKEAVVSEVKAVVEETVKVVTSPATKVLRMRAWNLLVATITLGAVLWGVDMVRSTRDKVNFILTLPQHFETERRISNDTYELREDHNRDIKEIRTMNMETAKAQGNMNNTMTRLEERIAGIQNTLNQRQN